MRACQEGRGGQRSIIEVTTDEAVGVALALGRQVYVDEDIWEGGRVSQARVQYSYRILQLVQAFQNVRRSHESAFITHKSGARCSERLMIAEKICSKTV